MTNPLSVMPDSELVARIRAGDEAAFEIVFLEHYPRLCILAARMTGSEALAEELVQDVMLRIWKHREAWDVNTTIGGYLTGAVRNHVLNQLGRARREKQWQERAARHDSDVVPLHGRPRTPDEDMGSTELAALIVRFVNELPPRRRQAFLLRRHQRLSYAEIARIMQVAPKTVEVQIGLALKSLREQLAEWL